MPQVTRTTLHDNLRIVTYQVLVRADEVADIEAALERVWEDDPTQWAKRGGPTTVEPATALDIPKFTSRPDDLGEYFFGEGYSAP